MTGNKYLYHEEELVIPDSFKELSDIVCRYEGTPYADIAIEAFENWDRPMIKWPSGMDGTNVDGQALSIAKMIATWSHNYHLSVRLGNES